MKCISGRTKSQATRELREEGPRTGSHLEAICGELEHQCSWSVAGGRQTPESS